MNQREFDFKYGLKANPPHSVGEIIRRQREVIKTNYCTRRGLFRTIQRHIPVLYWLRKYNLKKNLLSDLIAGATLGIYIIPQGMAYSMLASLPPVYGLYASFFPPLLYFFFGSSRHVSVGVFSLTSLMVGHTRLSILPDFANGTSVTQYKDIDNLKPIDIVVTLAFVTGIVQIIMAILRLDFLTSYLSDAAISGLTFGAACHALIAQLPGILGIKLHTQEATFLKIFYNIADLGSSLDQINLATTIVSIVSICTLITSKILIEQRCMRHGWPFPTELIVLIIGIIVSRSVDLSGRWNVKVIYDVPLGMPTPTLPRFELAPYLLEEACSIAIVAFAVTVSMGKLFAKKYHYPIDSNQELLALGTSGCISSFFSVFPTSTSLSRTLVNEGSGAKTQVSSLVSSCIILSVILWLGPLLIKLPMCILSSIVIVVLRSLFVKVTELPKLWKISKMDVVIWLLTLVITLCYDIIEGLIGGMVVALFLVVLRTQWPDFNILGEVGQEYLEIDCYSEAKVTEIAVVRFEAPIIFTNAEIFQKKIRNEIQRSEDKFSVERSEKGNISISMRPTWQAIVIDCSMWTYTDSMGMEAIRELNDDLLSQRVLLLFAHLKSSLRMQFARAEILNSISENQFYPSVEHALSIAAVLQRDSSEFFSSKSTVHNS